MINIIERAKLLKNRAWKLPLSRLELFSVGHLEEGKSRNLLGYFFELDDSDIWSASKPGKIQMILSYQHFAAISSAGKLFKMELTTSLR